VPNRSSGTNGCHRGTATPLAPKHRAPQTTFEWNANFDEEERRTKRQREAPRHEEGRQRAVHGDAEGAVLDDFARPLSKTGAETAPLRLLSFVISAPNLFRCAHDFGLSRRKNADRLALQIDSRRPGSNALCRKRLSLPHLHFGGDPTMALFMLGA